MPPREEQIAQIEAALRRRFFPRFPKVVIEGRENWTEEQHDIYAQSQPLRAVKGYLLIFRNLTDPQPLADGVIQRLSQLDAQRQAAQAAANATAPAAPANPNSQTSQPPATT